MAEIQIDTWTISGWKAQLVIVVFSVITVVLPWLFGIIAIINLFAGL